MKTRYQILYIIPLLLASLFVACNSDETKIAIEKKNKREAFVEDSLSFKVAILPTADCDNIRRAQAEGVFDSLGVTVHLREYNALSECRYALRKGLVQAAVIDSTLARIIIDEDKVELTYGPSTSLSWKLMSNHRSRVNRPAQLADKITAADSHGASHNLALAAVDSLLRKQVPTFVVQVEDVNVRYDMLNLGNVDAAMLPEPFAAKAIKAGHKVVKDYSDKKKGVIVFMTKDIKDKRIDNQRKLFLEALQYVAKHNAK